MTAVTDRKITRTVLVHAPADAIFAVLADPAKHPLIDGSGTVQASKDGTPQRLELGSTFGMRMKRGMPYSVTNKVVEYEKDRLIAWRHVGRHRWRWELKPIDNDTTEVTETFDWTNAPIGALYGMLGFLDANTKGIESSLARLESVVTQA